MFGVALKEVTGIVDRRFLLNAFFPSLIFWSLLLTVVLASRGPMAQTIDAWFRQDTTVTWIQIISLLAWVTFFAYVLISQAQVFLRLFEGYWDFPIGRWFAAAGRRRHQARLRELAESIEPNQDEQAYRHYPPPTRLDEVMPTRLGNLLKSAELYPSLRYGIDAVLFWPKLYLLFPDRFVALIAESRSALDFFLTLSSLSVTFSLIAGGCLLVMGGAWWLFLVCFWGGLLIAWLAYEASLRAALIYSEQIRSAFDLYRFDLLTRLRLPLPTTQEEERHLWQQLGQFVYRNMPPIETPWTYTMPPKPDK